jgi:hypothetical protein
MEKVKAESCTNGIIQTISTAEHEAVGYAQTYIHTQITHT